MSRTTFVALASIFASIGLGCGGGTKAAAQATTYRVTYDGNGSTGGAVPVDPNDYLPGVPVIVLGNIGGLFRAGHTFAGWNTRADGTGLSYVEGESLPIETSDVVLYATWSPGPTIYRVTYDGNGAIDGQVPEDPNVYAEGQTVYVLGDPSLMRPGSSFAGWNTRRDGTGSSYTQGQTFTIGAADVVLYARWTPLGPPTYRVLYDGNGATGGAVPVDPMLYMPGEPAFVRGNEGGLSRTGFVWTGWNTRADGTGVPVAQGEMVPIQGADVVLYATWSAGPATYAVRYDGNGATGGAVPVDSTAYLPGQTVTVLGNTGNLARTGYYFTGWNTSRDGTGTAYTPGQTLSIGAADVALYAIWSAVPPAYHVLYMGNGNTGGSVPVDSSAYELGQSFVLPGNTGGLTRTYYTFGGWNTRADGSGTTYQPGATIVVGGGDIVFFAYWIPQPTYTVTYDPNGASGGRVPYDDHRYHPGDQVTVYLRVEDNVWKAQDGFTWAFVGWNTAANGSGTTYTVGQQFTIGSANVTLYAKWTAIRVSGPAGGVIFYDAGSYAAGWRYLEAAPDDQLNYDEVPWYNGSYVQTGATSTALGAGRANTDAIVSAQGAGRYAARICFDLESGNRGDWYLPAREELMLMFNTLANYRVVGGLNWSFNYWSSSERIAAEAWTLTFNSDKAWIGRVHCVRSF